MSRFPFTPFPAGVFAVAFSREVSKKKILPVMFMGERLVIFRTESGKLGALESHCPHMGASLCGGTVKREMVQCPFHGLLFNINGVCAAKNHAGCDNTYQAKSYVAFEKYGVIFLTHKLHIEIPDWDLSEWAVPIEHCFKIKSHPQEILENTVDEMHFRHVHKYLSVEAVGATQIKGPEFCASYRLKRGEGIFSKQPLNFAMDIHTYGLGMSQVDITIPKYKLQAKQIVFPTPIDGEYVYVRAITSVKAPDFAPFIFKKMLANWLTRAVAKGFIKDFLPDVSIWENKKYISQPNYLTQDGNFDVYRQWATQFYSL